MAPLRNLSLCLLFMTFRVLAVDHHSSSRILPSVSQSGAEMQFGSKADDKHHGLMRREQMDNQAANMASFEVSAFAEIKDENANDFDLKKATLEAWVRWPSTSAGDVVHVFGGVGKGLYLKKESPHCAAPAGGGVTQHSRYSLRIGPENYKGAGSAAECRVQHSWVHVVAVKTCGNEIEFFINGVKSTGHLSSPTASCPRVYVDRSFGHFGTSRPNLINARVWKRDLLEWEILCYATKGPNFTRPLFTADLPHLVGYWPLTSNTKDLAAENQPYTDEASHLVEWVSTYTGSDIAEIESTHTNWLGNLHGVGVASCPDMKTDTTLQEVNDNSEGCEDDWQAAHHGNNGQSLKEDAGSDDHATCCLGNPADTGCIYTSPDGRDPSNQCATDIDTSFGIRGNDEDCCDYAKYCTLMEASLGSDFLTGALLQMRRAPRRSVLPWNVSDDKAIEAGREEQKTAAAVQPEKSDETSFAERVLLGTRTGVSERDKEDEEENEATRRRKRPSPRPAPKKKTEKEEEEEETVKGESSGGCEFSSEPVNSSDGKDLVQTRITPKVPEGATEPQETVLFFKFPANDYETGSISTPQGFTKEFSTDDGNTWHKMEPIAGVNKIKATGSFPPGPGAIIPMPPISAASVATKGSGGDGTVPMFLRNQIYFNFHHGPAKLLCINAEDGENCKHFPWTVKVMGTKVPSTTNAPIGLITEHNNRILVPAAIDTGGGFFCFTLDPAQEPKVCAEGDADRGWIPTGHSHNIGWGGPHVGIRKLFAVAQNTKNVYCVDSDAKKCEGFPFTAPFNVLVVRPMHKVPKIMVASNTNFVCVDVTGSPKICDGWDTITKGPTTGPAGTNPIMPIQDSRGFSIGACFNSGGTFHCYDVADGKQTNEEVQNAQKVIQAQMDSHPEKSKSNSAYYWGAYGTKSYASIGEWTGKKQSICYDGSKKTACKNFPFADGYGPQYAIVPSTGNNGGCIWRLGCRGILASFSARNPADKCGSSSPVLTVAPATAVCPGREGGPEAWKSVALVNVVAGDFEEAFLTAKDKTGAVVGDLDGTSLGTPADLKTIDLSSIPLADETDELEFHVTFNKVNNDMFARQKLPAVDLRWEGPPAEACVQSESPPEVSSSSPDKPAEDGAACAAAESRAFQKASFGPALLAALLLSSMMSSWMGTPISCSEL